MSAHNHDPAAAAICRACWRRVFYSLVFSDILMPGSIAGLEIARIVREHHAETPVLLVTGYSDKAQEAVHEGFPVIRKPYDLHGLSNAIRELRPCEQARAAD